MAANRIEASTSAPEEAAAASTAPAPAAGGGLKAWLPLVIALVAMPALAYATTMFLILPKLQKNLGLTATAAEGEHGAGEKGENARKETVPMTKLLVNVNGTMGQRYLLVSLSLVSTSTGFKEKLTEHDAQLRDMACGALSTKTLAALEQPGARNLIRAELMSGFNNILGSAMVSEIYMTEFAIQ